MRIAILGATGGTGRAVTELALAEGHEVTVLVRDPSRLALIHDHLTVIEGDALVAADVDAVIAGQESVFVSLGLSASGERGRSRHRVHHGRRSRAHRNENVRHQPAWWS